MSNKKNLKLFFLKTIVRYTINSCKSDNIEEVSNSYRELKKWLDDNYDDCYKGIMFGPKGEKFTRKFFLKIFVILDKMGILKVFLNSYVRLKK